MKLKLLNSWSGGVDRHDVQLERMNLSLIPTYSAVEIEWVMVEVVLHAASVYPRGTHFKWGKLLQIELIPIKV